MLKYHKSVEFKDKSKPCRLHVILIVAYNIVSQDLKHQEHDINILNTKCPINSEQAVSVFMHFSHSMVQGQFLQSLLRCQR